jgi:hypothetical protein
VVARALQAPVQQAAASGQRAAVLHMDETSWRQAGSPTRHWVWATVQPQVVVYQVLPSRARYVAQALAGERPAGVLVTDRYAVYDWVAPERRQVCWAHLLRDFERIGGRAGAAGLFSLEHRISDTLRVGMIVRVNQHTATLDCDDQKWRVAFELLRPLVSV